MTGDRRNSSRRARRARPPIRGAETAELGSWWTYLDPKQPREHGELAVVSYDPEMSVDFPDLSAFLSHYVEIMDPSIEAMST